MENDKGAKQEKRHSKSFVMVYREWLMGYAGEMGMETFAYIHRKGIITALSEISI